MQIIVDKVKCPQNHACPAIQVCPVDAIKQNGYGAPMIDKTKCIQCKKCVKFCPMKAIETN